MDWINPCEAVICLRQLLADLQLSLIDPKSFTYCLPMTVSSVKQLSTVLIQKRDATTSGNRALVEG